MRRAAAGRPATGARRMSAPISTAAELRAARSTLGVQSDYNEQELKAAYRQRAKEWHPDVAVGDRAVATARFKELSSAYEILCRRGTVDDAYQRLQSQRANEPLIIRWFWRGPSIGVKFGFKLSVMAILLVAAVVDDRDRTARKVRRRA